MVDQGGAVLAPKHLSFNHTAASLSSQVVRAGAIYALVCFQGVDTYTASR
jgi:hypothetical protein